MTREPVPTEARGGAAARPQKVFGGVPMSSGRQVRTIVAAGSKAEAARLLGVSLSGFDNWWAVTSNPVELAAALAGPRVVLRASSVHTRDFQPDAR